jgi:hypothetical protein
MVVVIYGDQGMQKFITTSSHDSTKQTSSNRVHLTKQSDYFTTALVLRAQEQVQLATSVDLTDFKLQRGIYSLQVIYYSGKKRSIITEDQVKQDLVKHKAKLFQGCLISNPVKLIVK